MSEQGIQFVLIDAQKGKWWTARFPDLRAAQREVGLDKVDHGILARGVAYVVYEYGFFAAPDAQHYFSFGQRLIAGNCVLYSIDETGETIDIERPPVEPVYYRNSDEVEQAITAGRLIRPAHTRNGVITWQWPQPKPEYMKR